MELVEGKFLDETTTILEAFRSDFNDGEMTVITVLLNENCNSILASANFSEKMSIH